MKSQYWSKEAGKESGAPISGAALTTGRIPVTLELLAFSSIAYESKIVKERLPDLQGLTAPYACPGWDLNPDHPCSRQGALSVKLPGPTLYTGKPAKKFPKKGTVPFFLTEAGKAEKRDSSLLSAVVGLAVDFFSMADREHKNTVFRVIDGINNLVIPNPQPTVFSILKFFATERSKEAGKRKSPGFPGPWATLGELTVQPSTKGYCIRFPPIVKGRRAGRHQPFLKNVGSFSDATGAGFEPTSLQLTADRSTVELPGKVLSLYTAQSAKRFPEFLGVIPARAETREGMVADSRNSQDRWIRDCLEFGKIPLELDQFPEGFRGLRGAINHAWGDGGGSWFFRHFGDKRRGFPFAAPSQSQGKKELFKGFLRRQWAGGSRLNLDQLRADEFRYGSGTFFGFFKAKGKDFLEILVQFIQGSRLGVSARNSRDDADIKPAFWIFFNDGGKLTDHCSSITRQP